MSKVPILQKIYKQKGKQNSQQGEDGKHKSESEDKSKKIDLIKKSNNQNLINLRQINYLGIKRRLMMKWIYHWLQLFSR